MYNNDFRPMKRAHSPDFESGNNNNNFRGGFRGHPNHSFNKRHRGDNFQQQPYTIEDKIVRLGDTGSRKADIGALAKDIDAELLNKAEEEEKIKLITSKICQCIVSFPSRIGTYATLIGLISVKHYNVSCQIISTLHASYPLYLEAQKWQEALTIMHLLSSLVNCKVIQPSAIISQFELFLESTLEDNIPQARSDYLVYTVLSSLPYVALELSTQAEQHTFEQLLNTIETYLTKRSKEHLKVTRFWLSNDSTVQMDYLDSLWVQTKNFRANSWNETFLHRPYNDKEYKDIMASSLIPQNSPTIEIPPHSDKYVYPTPSIVFRLFEDDVAEGPKQIPGSDKIERFCIENHIRNIIDELCTDSRDCARHLSHMYQADQLPIKHILIETILGELFSLPKTRHPEILYHSLLIEFMKIFNPSRNQDELKYNFDVILDEGVKVLYENLDTMNVTCFSRFVNWFSFHLNNTEFLYPWQTWSEATFKDMNSPKSLFVQEILDHCIRFSFHQKMTSIVSADLHTLMPPQATVKYQPIYTDNPKAEELASTIRGLIVEKADGKKICESLNVAIDGVELSEDFMLKEEKHSEKLLKIDIFTSVILDMASKSLTHLSSAIGKFLNLFKALIQIPEGQVQLLLTIHSCLENHHHLQTILIDKLLKVGLIEAKEVCNWIFSDRMKPHLLKPYIWDILSATTHRSSQVIYKLLKEKDEKSVEEKEKVKIKKEKDGDEKTDETEGEDVEMVTDEFNFEEIEAKIEKARASYNELMLQIFTLFSDVLGDHIRKCELSNTSYLDSWFNWITGRMQQVFYQHYDSILNDYDKIKSIIDRTPSIGNLIINFNQ